jgi:putative ABC transport system ATP-binding protein
MSLPTFSSSSVPQPGQIISVRGLTKVYGEGEHVVYALADVALDINSGEFVAIMGHSGSGKSTLMNILGCLDVPTTGQYHLAGMDVSGMNERQLSIVRNRRIGFVFQSFNLIKRTSALANVELPLAYAGVRAAERRERASAALRLVGLGARMGHLPNELSGGQQQRVAIARALVTQPAMILADEPTGNLDSSSTHEVLDLLAEVNNSGRTVIIITHEDDVAARSRRVLQMSDGKLVADSRLATPIDAGVVP